MQSIILKIRKNLALKCYLIVLDSFGHQLVTAGTEKKFYGLQDVAWRQRWDFETPFTICGEHSNVVQIKQIIQIDSTNYFNEISRNCHVKLIDEIWNDNFFLAL